MTKREDTPNAFGVGFIDHVSTRLDRKKNKAKLTKGDVSFFAALNDGERGMENASM